jgi:hypothetical protein
MGLALSAFGMCLSFSMLIFYGSRQSIYLHVAIATVPSAGNSTTDSTSFRSGLQPDLTPIKPTSNLLAGVTAMFFLGLTFALGYSFFWGLVTKMVDEVNPSPAILIIT